MYEETVHGEIKALGWQDGSSGIFTGSIEGLYEGYRLDNISVDGRPYVLELPPYGSIALAVRQQRSMPNPLPPRPTEHPFAQGRDPFPPGIVFPTDDSRSPVSDTSQERPGPLAIAAMDVRVGVDPAGSTGIFAAATGEMTLNTPGYKIMGRLVIMTQAGDLHYTFLENADCGQIRTDLVVDGEKSTGLYQGARGTLHFALAVMRPNFAQGPYEGVLQLQER